MKIYRLLIDWGTGGKFHGEDIYYDFETAIDSAHDKMDNCLLIDSIEIQEMQKGNKGYYVPKYGLLISRKKHVHK